MRGRWLQRPSSFSQPLTETFLQLRLQINDKSPLTLTLSPEAGEREQNRRKCAVVLVAVRLIDPRGKRLMIVTQAGEAPVTSTATNYEQLRKILPDLIPQCPRNVSADHPDVMKLCALWSLFTTLAGLMTGWFVTALNASNSSLFLHLLVGAVVGAALPFLAALLLRRMRGS